LYTRLLSLGMERHVVVVVVVVVVEVDGKCQLQVVWCGMKLYYTPED